VLALERVVVAYYAAGFRPEFISCARELSYEAKFWPSFHYVQDVGVVIQTVEAVWICFHDRVEDCLCFVEFPGMVVKKCTLGFQEGGGREDGLKVG